MFFVKWDKSKTESKIDIPTHFFTEIKLMLELCDELELAKEKIVHFL